jgi:hypothetical protein
MHRLDHPIDRRERDFLQCGPHLFAMLTAPNNGTRGDFNCVLTNADCTGSINYSKTLDKIIR